MIVSHHKEKAFNAIIYFLSHTSMCFKKKTYKLLWLLDSEHFKHAGRSVTGYDYFAWKMGPVPTELHEAMDSSDPDLAEYFDIEKQIDGRYTKIILTSKREFEPKYFSKRELRLMERIADDFYMATGEEMEEFTHRPGTPWYKVWVEEKRQQGRIPYEYALDSLEAQEKETILTIAKEREVFLTNYR